MPRTPAACLFWSTAILAAVLLALCAMAWMAEGIA